MVPGLQYSSGRSTMAYVCVGSRVPSAELHYAENPHSTQGWSLEAARVLQHPPKMSLKASACDYEKEKVELEMGLLVVEQGRTPLELGGTQSREKADFLGVPSLPIPLRMV